MGAGGSEKACSDNPPVPPLPVDPSSRFWPQYGANNTKCIDGQHQVKDQITCQAEAVAAGQQYYQYAVKDGRGYCQTSRYCSKLVTGTDWNWKVYTSNIYGYQSYPGLDGINIWPLLMAPGTP